MVLKRKRGDAFVPWTSSPPEQPQTSAQHVMTATDPVLPPEKKTRANPPRSMRSTTFEAAALPVPKAKAPAPKKTRAPRNKKAAQAPPIAVPGPSSSQAPAPTPTPVPAKRGRKKAADSEPSGSQPKPEKRLAQFKPHCPQNILDRLGRVRSQRIFMIARERNGDELKEKFTILGSTNNVYTVTIEHLPRCNCPDAVKGNHCKHILFVFTKVLQVSEGSGLWYQKALLTSELEKIFSEAPLAPNSMAHAHIRDAYARATGKAPAAATPADTGNGNRRIPGPDDDCPICYDGMHGTAVASLVFCEECGNALHKECFGEWQKTACHNGKELTCVWCRAPWVVAPAAGAGGARKVPGGYLNLGAAAGGSPVRDTSTYYHGPRRGQRYYGFQAYDDN